MDMSVVATVQTDLTRKRQTGDTNIMRVMEKFESKLTREIVEAASKVGAYMQMNAEVVAEKIIKLLDVAENVSHIAYVLSWIAQNGGNFSAAEMDRYEGGEKLKNAKTSLQMYRTGKKGRQEGRIPPDVVTSSRLQFFLHFHVIDMMANWRTAPQADIMYVIGDKSFSDPVLCSVMAPYCYEATSDATGIVWEAIMEWTAKHHATVNPKGKNDGKHPPLNIQIIKSKVTTSRMMPNDKAKYTQLLGAFLAAQKYSAGKMYPSEWKELVEDPKVNYKFSMVVTESNFTTTAPPAAVSSSSSAAPSAKTK